MNRFSMQPYGRSRSLFDLMSEFDSLFNDSTSTPRLGHELSNWRPAVDVEENELAYLLSFDLPGVKKEDIKIDLQDRRLSVSGTRTKESKDEREGKIHQFERVHGEFHRSFILPENVDAQKIEAVYDDGVLQLIVPKSEQPKPQSIQVQSGRSSFFDKLLGSKKNEKEVKTH